MYPPLRKSYKGLFPFKIGTTSFIYPDDYVPNVKMLGPCMDEIELLMFESQAVDSIPSNAVIAKLGQLSRKFDLSYNVHLPTDVSITDRDHARQKNAVDSLARVIEHVQPLLPSALVLHLPFDDTLSEQNISIWRDRVYRNLKKL